MTGGGSPLHNAGNIENARAPEIETHLKHLPRREDSLPLTVKSEDLPGFGGKGERKSSHRLAPVWWPVRISLPAGGWRRVK